MESNRHTVTKLQPSAMRKASVVLAGKEGFYADAQERRIVDAPAAPTPRTFTSQFAVRQEQQTLLANVVPVATTVVQATDDELTRAKATVVFTLPLSVALALVVTATVLSLSGAPVLSAWALITFFTVFALSWGAAIAFFVARSPSGTAYMHTHRLWKVIENEQAHRHEVEWYLMEREERSYEQHQR